MDKLTALSVFRRVAELESFSRAARALGLSSAAVSKNVRELEEQLGTRLIHRTTRRMHLTPAGEAYYERTAAILDQLRDADTTITDLGALRRELEEVRHQGVAFDRQEFHVGVDCVAAPIRTGKHVVAALTVSAPSERFARDQAEIIQKLLQAAAGASTPQ